jgi:branched-chain amino acid transport system ATP-binding protein
MSAESESLLSGRGLRAGYGRSQVLFDIDIDVPARGGLAILGRNGAGKTTLLRALVGEIPVQGGSVALEGQRLNGLPVERRARRGIGYVPQDQAVFSRLSVRENLQVGAQCARNERSIDRVLESFPKLKGRLDQAAGTLSGGERKMLAICRALLGQPRVLLLDEPTEGVWIGVVDEIADRLVQLAREMAVVIVEQHLELAWRVAERACVIDRGRIALDGPSAQVRDAPELLRLLAP